MKMQWERFEGKPFTHRSTGEIRITLGAKGVFYLNGPAFDVLGQPAAVELMYEGNRRIIGLKPIDPQRRNAFPVREHKRNGSYKRINGAAFCQHFRLRPEATLLFDGADLDTEGVMQLDMNRSITVGRGAR